MSARIFNSPEEVVEYIVSRKNEAALGEVEFGEGFNLIFEIDGETWNGEIDYRVGRFIYDFQRDVMGIYNETTGKSLSFRNKYSDIKDVVVSIRVNNGCTEILAKLDKVLTQMIQGMTGDQIMVSTIALGALIVSGYVFKKYIDRKEKADSLAANNAIALKAMEAVNNNSTAFANLLAKADREDTVKIKSGKEVVEMSVPAARENLPVAENEEPNVRSLQVWGDFTLNTLDARTYTFSLSTIGIPAIRAITSFSNANERIAFSRKYAEFMSESVLPRMRLLLSIVINCDTNAIEGARILKILEDAPEGIDIIQDAIN